MKNSLVELHCHILPGIDDGARDLDMSMSLMRREVSDGVVGVVFTPHFHYERITVEKFVELRKGCLPAGRGCGPHRGAARSRQAWGGGVLFHSSAQP